MLWRALEALESPGVFTGGPGAAHALGPSPRLAGQSANQTGRWEMVLSALLFQEKAVFSPTEIPLLLFRLLGRVVCHLFFHSLTGHQASSHTIPRHGASNCHPQSRGNPFCTQTGSLGQGMCPKFPRRLVGTLTPPSCCVLGTPGGDLHWGRSIWCFQL